GVELSDGTVLDADLVILGVGVKPRTDLLKDVPGVRLEADSGVITDEYFQVSGCPDIWAAGDIAKFPYKLQPNLPDLIRIEHWDVAQQQGRIAGTNMVASFLKGDNTVQATPYKSVPFFFTMQYGKSVRYAGAGHGYDHVEV